MNILRKQFLTELNNIVGLANKDKTDAALEKLELLIKSYKSEYNDLELLGELYTWKAWVYDQNKDYNKGILLYQKALQYPSTSLAFFNIINGLSSNYKKTGEKNKALESLKKGINEIKDSTLKLKLIKTYHDFGGIPESSIKETIQQVIKYYGLKVSDENKSFINLLDLAQGTLDEELEKFNKLDIDIINSKKVSEVEDVTRKYLVTCNSIFFKNKAETTLEEIRNGEDKYNNVMALINNKPNDFVMSTLEDYKSGNNPIFYKRLIRDFMNKRKQS